VQYLRSCPNGFDLTSSKLSDLMCVECFPAVKLDEPDTLKHLRRQSNSFICKMHALLSLSEHDLDAYNLNGEADDKDLWVTAVKLSMQLKKETINLPRALREPNSPTECKCKFEYKKKYGYHLHSQSTNQYQSLATEIIRRASSQQLSLQT